jgi:hypothetical protein
MTNGEHETEQLTWLAAPVHPPPVTGSTGTDLVKVKKCWKGGRIALAVLASIGLVASAAQPAAARVGGLAQTRAAASTGRGYWLVTSCGEVLAFGSAKF